MADSVESVERLHDPGGEDVHIRLVGSMDSRPFLVNIQFAAAPESTYTPEEADRMAVQCLALITRCLERA